MAGFGREIEGRRAHWMSAMRDVLVVDCNEMLRMLMLKRVEMDRGYGG